MQVNTDFILLLATGLSMALLFGLIARRLRLPPLLGYMLAGLLLSPHAGLVHINQDVAHQMAELGIIFLMFEVGLHFSWRDLNAVKNIAISGALGQMFVATLSGALLAWGVWHWNLTGAITFGLSLAVASTIVLIRGLEQNRQLHTINGKIAIGWLLVEDMMTVLALIVLPVMASSNTPAGAGSLLTALATTAGKLVLFAAIILMAGKWIIPRLLKSISVQGSRELFTIAIVAIAVGIAFLAYKVFGVSMALGAFIAGMVVKQAEYTHEAESETQTLRGIFSVLFFVSVGMLFNPAIFLQSPGKVLAVTAIILLLKTVTAALIILIRGYPLNTALTVAVGLAQIGEFSFILAALAGSLKILPEEGQQLILAGAFISISLNPFLLSNLKRLETRLVEQSRLAARLALRIDKLSMLPDYINQDLLNRQIVIIGYGQVGKQLYRQLADEYAIVVIEENRELVQKLRASGIPAVSGDASQPMTLVQAHVQKARSLIITTAELYDVTRISDLARQINPEIELLLCLEKDQPALTEHLGSSAVVFTGPQALAASVAAHLTAEQKNPA